MKIWIFAASLLFVNLAQAADETVLCNVRTLADAQACMEKLAAKVQDYEEPNDGFASADKSGLVALFKDWGFVPSAIREVQDADFIGGLLVHMDEHHLVYYAIKRGQNVSPVEIYDFNTVDLEYMLKGPLKADSASAKIENYFLGLDGRSFDVYGDLETSIEMLLNPEN